MSRSHRASIGKHRKLAWRPGNHQSWRISAWVGMKKRRPAHSFPQTDATVFEWRSTDRAGQEGRNLFPAAALCDSVQLFTTEGESSGAGTRTPDTRIMIPLPESHNDDCGNELAQLTAARAARGAAVSAAIGAGEPSKSGRGEALDRRDLGQPAKPLDADLIAVADAWPRLSNATRRCILGLVERGSNTSGRCLRPGSD